MTPHYQLVAAPLSEPVSYDQVAEHVRVDSVEDMEYLSGLIAVAREYVESVTGRASVSGTWRVVAPSWAHLIDRNWYAPHSIPLYRSPLVSVSSVKYYANGSEAPTTVSSTAYRVITGTEPGIVQFLETPPTHEDRPDAVQIEFVAGYSDSDLTPAVLRHAIKLVAAHLYENRVPIAFAQSYEIPFTLKTLLENQKTGGWIA